MNRNTIPFTVIATAAAIALTAVTAAAHDHHDSIGGQMKHIYVTLDATALGAVVGDPAVTTPQLSDLSMGHDYTGDKSVLNGTAHNAQYGWMTTIPFLPADTGLFVRLLDQTPGLRTYSQDDFAPLFGTEGASDTWSWNGSMIHNWYAIDLDQVTAPDMPLFASYEVYLGHAGGPNYADPITGYSAATVRLDFTAIPEPSIGAVLLGLPLIFGRRRRADGCIIRQ